jgi:hypothetical protein
MRPGFRGLPIAAFRLIRRLISALSPTTTLMMKPPSVQSPFAHSRHYLDWGDVFRLLGGHYSSVVAHTDSCANPIWLSRTSAFASIEESSQVATSLCCQWDLPDVISANLSSDAWSLTTAGSRSAFTCFFLHGIGLPQQRKWVGLPASPANTIFPRSVFRGCRHFFMFRPPSLLASQIVPTVARYSRRAAETFTSEQSMLRYLTCIGYASRPNTGNWRHGDSHLARFAALSAAPLCLRFERHFTMSPARLEARMDSLFSFPVGSG